MERLIHQFHGEKTTRIGRNESGGGEVPRRVILASLSSTGKRELWWHESLVKMQSRHPFSVSS